MKYLKYALFALLGLFILVAAGLAYVAATFNPNQYKPQIVQAVKEKTGRTLRLDGDIGFSVWPLIGARVGKASLSERGSEKEFASVEEVQVALKLMPLLSGQAIADTVRIKGLRASIVRARDGRLNVDDLAGDAAPSKPAPAEKRGAPDLVLDIAGVEVVDATIAYADQAAGTKVQLGKLSFKTGRIAPGTPTAFEFSTQVRGSQPKLDLAIALKARLTADATKKTAALDDIALDAKGDAAGLSNLTVKLAGNAAVDRAKQHAQAALAGKLVDSAIKARFEVAGFSTPSIRFDVDVDQLDLDRYLAAPASGAKPASGKPAAAGKEAPFDLTGLRSLRAAGTLKVGAFKASNVKAANVRMNLKAQGGRVDINPLNADFYQGKLASVISINAAPAVPVFSVKNDMSGIALGPFLKDLADNDMLEGKGDVTVDVTTQGSTVAALKRALGGSAGLKLADGALKGIDIAGSIRNARAKLGALRGEQTQAADKSQKTDFSELTATFRIANGVAHNNDLSLKSPLLRVGGEGDVNIGADTINYLVKASIVGTSKGQGGRDVDELHGLTVPVRVTGPLAAPSYKIDFGSMAKDTAKQAVGGLLQKRLGGGKADAGKKEGSKPGGLRGLLGR